MLDKHFDVRHKIRFLERKNDFEQKFRLLDKNFDFRQAFETFFCYFRQNFRFLTKKMTQNLIF